MRSPSLLRHARVALLALAAGCAASRQTSFASPDAAVESLVSALRADDTAKLHEILGPAGDDILSSGDEVADRADVQRFLAYYDEGYWVRQETGDVSTLVVGTDGWPFPVPIVRSKGKYVFDTETGRDEILNRRIGRNELDAVQVCLAIADAQREYVERRPMGGDLPEYAMKLVSDPGKKNGLYWPTAEGEEQSPLGPLVASATAGGYCAPSSAAAAASEKDTRPTPRPYHGYRYRLLTAQGAHAHGGALNYLVNGRLIGGFAVVAYPAEYGNSGIMTFITNHDGVVYQRDFGDDTEKVGESMTEFDPDPAWLPAAQDDRPASP